MPVESLALTCLLLPVLAADDFESRWVVPSLPWVDAVQLRRTWQDGAGYDVTAWTNKFSFIFAPDCSNKRATGPAEVVPEATWCDWGQGFGHSDIILPFGWLCGDAPFDHVQDAWLTPRRGVFHDFHLSCSQNVSWRVKLPEAGLYYVLFKTIFLAHSVPSGCFLNGYRVLKYRFRREHLVWREEFAVIVGLDGEIRLSGRPWACGLLQSIDIRKPHAPVGDVDCWTNRSVDYHLCCTMPSMSSAESACFLGSFTFQRCCRTPKRSLKVHSLLQAHHLPRKPVDCVLPSLCQRHCLGSPPSFYAEPPQWVLEVPAPRPLVCGDLRIYPISYGVPSELVVPCLPPKSYDFPLLWPGDSSTYIFRGIEDKEVALLEYVRMYRSSMFAITFRKACADGLRHTEILASGSIPLMPDVSSLDSTEMPHHHKGLLRRALALPGVHVGWIDDAVFNVTAYLDVAQDLLLWTRHRLTTAAIASYFLETLGVSTGDRLNVTILFLVPRHGAQAMHPASFSLLHGLREVLVPYNVVDYPFYEGRYELDPGRPAAARSKEAPQGWGMFEYWRLPREEQIDRRLEHLSSRLAKDGFTFVVYGFLGETELDDDVRKHVPRARTVAVCGFDHMAREALPWLTRVGHFFKYNLKDMCPTDEGWY